MFRCESRAALAAAEASRGSIERFIGPFKRATKEPVLYLGAVIPLLPPAAVVLFRRHGKLLAVKRVRQPAS
jgi:hypothetical protein